MLRGFRNSCHFPYQYLTSWPVNQRGESVWRVIIRAPGRPASEKIIEDSSELMGLEDMPT